MKHAGIESLKRKPYTIKGMCAHSRVDRSISVQEMIPHLVKEVTLPLLRAALIVAALQPGCEEMKRE